MQRVDKGVIFLQISQRGGIYLGVFTVCPRNCARLNQIRGGRERKRIAKKRWE